MSELCFNVCVWDFGTNEVSKEWNSQTQTLNDIFQVRNREDRCAMSCTEKYMKASKAMGSSFTETHPANNFNN